MGLSWALRSGSNQFRALFVSKLLSRRLLHSRYPPTAQTAAAAAMATSAANDQHPERWEEVLDHLSSMISGKRKADGQTWRDAHENMPVYLQVGVLVCVAALHRQTLHGVVVFDRWGTY